LGEPFRLFFIYLEFTCKGPERGACLFNYLSELFLIAHTLLPTLSKNRFLLPLPSRKLERRKMTVTISNTDSSRRRLVSMLMV
jgi:hypothetical protein